MLRFYSGPMWAGKTTRLIEEINGFRASGMTTLVIKPKLDTRYGYGAITSHDGKSRAATMLDSSELPEVLNIHAGLIEALVVDEVQFFTDALALCIRPLVEANVQVVCGGLDLDCFGDWFSTSRLLSQMASDNVSLYSECECGYEASRTQRFAPDGTPVTSGDIVAVGAADLYRPVCLECWVGPNE